MPSENSASVKLSGRSILVLRVRRLFQQPHRGPLPLQVTGFATGHQHRQGQVSGHAVAQGIVLHVE